MVDCERNSIRISHEFLRGAHMVAAGWGVLSKTLRSAMSSILSRQLVARDGPGNIVRHNMPSTACYVTRWNRRRLAHPVGDRRAERLGARLSGRPIPPMNY
jgi:hypothetical protein